MSLRRKLLLNGEWEFAEGGDGAAPEGGWRRVRVPHRSREFEEDPPVSGWYRTSLAVPEGWETGDGRRLFLDLDRVRHYGRAYLDGDPVEEHHHLRLPWLIDLTDRAAPGSEHELVLFTHACRGRYAHPGAEELSEAAEKALDTRFWHTSAATVGIEGDAWLRCRPLVHLADPYVITSVRGKTLSAEVTVRNDGPERFRGLVSWEVARAGETVLPLPPREVEVGPGETAAVGCTEEWADAVPWGRPPYGEPVLYFLRIDLSSDRQGPVDGDIARFGFREIRADGERLLLNGEQLIPWGDHTVPYVYERQWLTRKFSDLAAANVSIVEHHRYDPPSVFYDVADESGTFVVGANFCVGTGQVFPEDLDGAEASLVMENHLAVADAWIRRTRNHPSILFWDVTDARDPAFCVPLLRKVKELDPTRIAEVTFDPGVADSELVGLIDCYRLFSGFEQIEAAIETLRTDPALPRKPVRVGEAGIFESGRWDLDGEPPLMEGWWDFLLSMPERNIHGLQTFFLADMDYRGFTGDVPGSLAAPVEPQVSWPSQSGADARIDPFGEGTQAAWGKAALYLNWCDPEKPLVVETATRQWSRDLYRRIAGRDVGPLNSRRLPEVIVETARPGAPVFVEPLAGQAAAPFGVRADGNGRSWFVLPEPGPYRFTCGPAAAEVVAQEQPVDAPPGYGHIQRVSMD